MKKYSLGSISENRDTIYGLSALWIAFFHSTVSLKARWLLPLKMAQSYGNMGVDIFLMVSGISLYFSFTKDSDLRRFYAKRLKRVVLPFLLIGIPYFLYEDIFGGKGTVDFLLDISAQGLFVQGKRIVWFVSAILVFYLLYPALYAYFRKKDWSFFSLLELLAAVIVMNEMVKYLSPRILHWGHFWGRMEILFRRIPVFAVGTYLGKAVYEKKEIPVGKYRILLAACLSYAAFIIEVFAFDNENLAFERYTFIPLSFVFMLAFSVLGEWKFFKNTAGRLAPYTLEIYLTHQELLLILTKYMQKTDINVINLLAITGSILLSIAVKKLEDRILKNGNVPLSVSNA